MIVFGGDASLRNGLADWRGKQILKGNMTKTASIQGEGVHTPCNLPLDPPLTALAE